MVRPVVWLIFITTAPGSSVGCPKIFLVAATQSVVYVIAPPALVAEKSRFSAEPPPECLIYPHFRWKIPTPDME